VAVVKLLFYCPPWKSTLGKNPKKKEGTASKESKKEKESPKRKQRKDGRKERERR